MWRKTVAIGGNRKGEREHFENYKSKTWFYHNTTDIKALLYSYASFPPGGQISLITDSAGGGALKHLSLKLATSAFWEDHKQLFP